MTRAAPRALVIINPIAGPGRTRTIGACRELATTVLAEHRFEVDIRVTTGPVDAHGFAREGLAQGVSLVVAWGGDGTVNGAASAVAGSGVPLAIVPGGSGNGLARDLGVPLDAAAALAVAATGGSRDIDAGELGGALFFNVAGIGLDARIASRLASPHHRRGLIGYVQATVAELRAYTPCAYSLRHMADAAGHATGDDLVDRAALFVALANSRQYGNGAQIAPRAKLDDGLIEIVMVEPQSAFGIVRRLPSFFAGTLSEGAGILMRRASAMEVSCREPMPFHVDGEPRTGSTQLSMAVRPGVLRVKVSH